MRNNEKITNAHLGKKAIVYIRQSTMRQVYENSESTVRQYALKDALIAHGWSKDQIMIIDQDLGKSGTDSENRLGFQQLVSEVSNNMVGAVACIECSRLSRHGADWSRLIQFCAYTNTLLIDADGVYNPNDFNDKLLLGLKGTMSEAELHFLQERMRGGLMSKAKRGELKKPVPIGYVYHGDCLIKDPDMEVQNAIDMVFEAFRRVGSAHGVVPYFRTRGYKFPHRIGKGFRNDDLEWIDLGAHQVRNILHNPCYAGVYVFGKSQTVWTPEGKKSKQMPQENWHVFIKDHHAQYITYDEYEANKSILQENLQQRKGTEKRTPPREGTALIQGIVWCGKCGHRMTVRYKYRNGKQHPVYVCQKAYLESGGDLCQQIPGSAIDEAISELLVSKLTPEVIAQTVEVQNELDRRQNETLNYYQMRVEKCRYEAELARKRFMGVDPDNRLVALELESSWNIKLKNYDDAINELDEQTAKTERRRKGRDYAVLDNLSKNFSEAFQSDGINHKEKKRMVRYLIEDVTLTRSERSISIKIRYKGHTTKSIEIDAPLRIFEKWTTSPDVIAFIDSAAETEIIEDIAKMLNNKGFKSGKGAAFTPNIVKRIMYANAIPNKKERLLEQGYVINTAKAASMGITTSALMGQIRTGKFQGECVRVNARNEYVFPPESGAANV